MPDHTMLGRQQIAIITQVISIQGSCLIHENKADLFPVAGFELSEIAGLTVCAVSAERMFIAAGINRLSEGRIHWLIFRE